MNKNIFYSVMTCTALLTSTAAFSSEILKEEEKMRSVYIKPVLDGKYIRGAIYCLNREDKTKHVQLGFEIEVNTQILTMTGPQYHVQVPQSWNKMNFKVLEYGTEYWVLDTKNYVGSTSAAEIQLSDSPSYVTINMQYDGVHVPKFWLEKSQPWTTPENGKTEPYYDSFVTKFVTTQPTK